MKHMISCFCYATIIALSCNATLKGDIPTDALSLNSFKCTKEELMTFFPKQVVQAVLIKAQIPKEQAETIAEELSKKNQELTKIVEEKAAKLDPNPFKDLSQRDLAIKIHHETLYEIFSKVLKSHGISDESKIQTLLDELRTARSKLFVECIRQQQIHSPSE